MAKQYWLDNSAGRLLSPTDPADATDTLLAPNNNGVVQANYDEPSNSSLIRTSTGTFSVEVNITSSSNNTQMRMRLARLNSGGTVQATSANTAFQSTATTGLKNFSLNNPALGTWSVGDRLRVILEVQNTAAHGGDSGPTYETGTANSEVQTPFNNAPFVPVVDAFRWYVDTAGEASSAPLAAQDTSPTINVVNNSSASFHLRFRIQETGGGDGLVTDDYRLQYRIDGGAWADVLLASFPVSTDTTSQLTNGSPTTNRASNGITDGTGSFVAGEQEEDNGVIEDHQLTGGNFTEHVWAIEIFTIGLDGSGKLIEFRILLNESDTAITNSVTPGITINRTFTDSVTETVGNPTGEEYARPISTLLNTGGGGGWGASHTTLHGDTDEETPDDGDRITAVSAFTVEECVLGLSSVPDPGVHTGHVIRLRGLDDSGFLDELSVILRQDTTIIAAFAVSDITASFALHEFPLSEAQAAEITDYSDLNLGFVYGSGSSTGTCEISWAEFAVPSTAGSGAQDEVDAEIQTDTPGVVDESTTADDTTSSTAVAVATATESVTAVDSATGIKDTDADLSETATAQDDADGVVSKDVVIEETVTAAETYTGAVTTEAAAEESVSAVDEVSGTFVVVAAATETATAEDASTGVLSADVDLSESVTAQDESDGAVSQDVAVTEAVSAVEACDSVVVTAASLQETATAVDAPDRTVDTAAAVTETVTVEDAVSGTFVVVAAVAESATADDAASADISVEASLTESATAQDEQSVTAVFEVSRTEAATAQDETDFDGSTTGAVSETVTADDEVSATAVRVAAQTEAVFAIDFNDAYTPQFLRPDLDIEQGQWSPSTGTDLFAMVDEAVPDDGDYIFTEQPSVCEMRLSAGDDPEVSTGHILEYRIRGDASADLIVRLKEGSTVIASWTELDVPAGETDFQRQLTPTEADAITDYTNLSVESEAVV